MNSNISKIHPIKRDSVFKVLTYVENNAQVNKVIIFGSAIRDDCTENSDIDICIDLSCDTKSMQAFRIDAEIGKICNYNCDRLYYNDIAGPIKEQIDKTGVIIYER